MAIRIQHSTNCTKLSTDINHNYDATSKNMKLDTVCPSDELLTKDLLL